MTLTLHIYPTDHTDWVLLRDEKGFYVRQRDVIFAAFDLYKMFYKEVILHTSPLETV